MAGKCEGMVALVTGASQGGSGTGLAIEYGGPEARDATMVPVRAKAGEQKAIDALGRHADKLARGLAEVEFTLDLHGCTLDQAHARLLHGLAHGIP